MIPFKRTVKEILDFKSDVYIDNIYDMNDLFSFMGYEIGISFELNSNANLSRIGVNVKYDVSYDSRRGSTLQVLELDNIPIAIYMGAGRDNEDRRRICILDLEKCLEVIDIVKYRVETCDCLVNLDTEIELLFWEETPVDLGTFGRVKVI